MARPYLILKRYKVINKGSNYKTHYKLENVTDKHCPNCDELLFNEIHKDLDYPYVCLYCDENFYNIELKVTAYRNYYKGAKKYFAKWDKLKNIPDWWMN